VLHTAAYRELGLADWRYEAIECDEARLPGLLASLGPDWAGLSLTMPLKRAVLPLLDRADPLVAEVGAANTVLLAEGARIGHNTDVPGMDSALREAGVRVDGPVLVLGGGATACSAAAALRRAGVPEVTVAVREPGRAGELLATARRIGLAVQLAEWQPAGSWRLMLSTVPAGAADSWAAALAAGHMAADAVFDVVYRPWPTALAEAAAVVGAQVIGGFELLLRQAAEQVRLMTGRPAPISVMRAAGLEGLRDHAAGR
jgi:shikimate dehydrogenase